MAHSRMEVKPVFLGAIDKEIGPQQAIEWNVNKIGGKPIWVKNHSQLENLKCALCSRLMALVAQMDCPIGSSLYHRLFFIYCCISKPCWNNSKSWSVIRCQSKDTILTTPNLETVQGKVDSLFLEEDSWEDDEMEDLAKTSDVGQMCDAMNSFTLPIAMKKTVEEFQEEISEIFSNVIPETFPSPQNLSFPWTKTESPNVESSGMPVFIPHFIEVFEEPEESFVDESEHVKTLLAEYERESGNPFYNMHKELNILNRDSKEVYERTDVKHGDKHFYKFCKRVKRLPYQIIRYCWEGSPLYISEPTEDMMNPPLCQYCGSKKVFEFQLMPALITKLKFANCPLSENLIEFGTVLIFSCQNSCWFDNDSMKFETVFLQADPDEKHFQR